MYDFGSGRAFTSRDPLDGVSGTTTVANPYHYTYNDPLNKVDPTGLRPSDDGFDEPKQPDPTPCSAAAGAPGFLGSGSAMNHRPDATGATAQLYQFSIPTKPCKGVVRMNGFIQQDAVAAPLGILSMGDNRSFDARSTGRESRGSIELDFQRGTGSLFVNYACHVLNPGSINPACYSADPIGGGRHRHRWSAERERLQRVLAQA